MRAAMIGSAALMLAGCGHLPFGHRAVPRGGETITYELAATAFCLSCASFVVTLGPDGQGIFTGGEKAVAAGDHRFHASPEAVRAFARRLAPYRPTREAVMTPGQRSCPAPATDQNTLDIRWHSADGTSSHLAFYEGCASSKNPKMAEDLSTAPALLPIADLIGHR